MINIIIGISGGYYLISIIAVISSVIAGVYYVRRVQLIYFQTNYSIFIWQKVLKKNEDLTLLSPYNQCNFFYNFIFNIFPNFLLQITHDATLVYTNLQI